MFRDPERSTVRMSVTVTCDKYLQENKKHFVFMWEKKIKLSEDTAVNLVISG